MNLGISIIIPVHNGAATLARTIDSVLAQGYVPCELVVVDDGSTDDAAAVLEPYLSKLTYIRQEKSGLAAACNRGLHAASQPLILFLGAEAELLPNKLQQQAAFLQLHPQLGYVSSGWQRVGTTGQFVQLVEPWREAPTLDVETWLTHRPVQLGAILLRRIWLNLVGGLDATLPQAYAMDLMLRLNLAGCAGAWLYEPTIRCCLSQSDALPGGTAVYAQSIVRVLDKFFAYPDIPERLRADKTRTYFALHLWLAWRAALLEDRETAVSLLQNSIPLSQENKTSLEQTVVEWLFHFVNWALENGRTPLLPDTTWAIFQAAAPDIPLWPTLRRLADWWRAGHPAAVRAAFTPFDLWRIFQLGLVTEREQPQLTAELVLAWWALVWQPYAHKRFDEAQAGWAHFPQLDQPRLLQLVRAGLAAGPGPVSSTTLSLLWQDACASGLLLDTDCDEAAFFAGLPGLRQPRVSVIVPVYNGAAHIVETVESVRAQTYPDWELIVVDDGSTDGTVTALRPYRGLLRLVQQENQGVSAARNHGLRLALGDFVLFLDSDDLLYPDKLRQQVAILEADHLLGAVHSGWRLVDEYGRSLRSIRPWQRIPELELASWLQWKPVFLGAMLFRRSWLQRIDGFRTNLRQAEDTDFLLRLSLAGCPMRWFKRVTVDYRQHGAGVTRDGRRQAQDLLTVLQDFFEAHRLPPHIQAMGGTVQQSTLIWLVWQLYRTGYLEEIEPYLQRATTVNGTHPAIILAQTWLVQLATYAHEEGLDVTELRAFYPYFQRALQLSGTAWTAVERMLDWWLAHWQLLHQGTLGNLYQVQQIVYGALHLEEDGHIRSAVAWVVWWLKVWRCFLPHAACGSGHELAAFQDKPVAEIVHLAKGAIVYAPHKIDAWQILTFWQQAQQSGLVPPAEKYQAASLFLTFFGQSLLGKQWGRALRGLGLAVRFSWHWRAVGVWGEFFVSGWRYWRNGRTGGQNA